MDEKQNSNSLPPLLGMAILAYFWTGQVVECTWEGDGCYTRKGARLDDGHGKPARPISWQLVRQG